MRIQSIAGNVAEVAPRSSEIAILWLRSGFNLRFSTWHFEISKKWPLVIPEGLVDAMKPWKGNTDTLFAVEPPFGRTRYVYVFANPSDSQGYAGVEEVSAAIDRAFDRARSLGVRSAALIHIPVVGCDDAESARAMVVAIDRWDCAHPRWLEDVVLVDRTGDFRRILSEPRGAGE